MSSHGSDKDTFTIKLNGRDVEANKGETILDVAKRENVGIPTLCYHEQLEAHGGCRLCIVEAKMGKRTKMVTACNYEVWEGLEILTDSERVHRNRKLTVELLLSKCPEAEVLHRLARVYKIKHPRFKKEDDDCILCGLCVRICREKMGAAVASFVNRGPDMIVDTPYHRGSDVCLSCGACETVCPTNSIRLKTVYPKPPEPKESEFEMGLKSRPAVYIPFTQALPNVPVIDRDNCVHFNTGGCGICESVCPVEAIDYDQEDEIVDVKAGAVILSPGFCLYDSSQKPEFGYESYPNVVSSLQFERILSASGPCNGKVLRPSDGDKPDTLAFIQCVGSRDAENNFCSSVCCMYAIKEAIMAIEHEPDLKCEVFFMDIRAHGKGFDEYYERAKSLGIKFTRCRPSKVEQLDDSRNLRIGYVNEDTQEYETKEFEMVVLSAGLQPPKNVRDLAAKFGVRLNKYGFAETKPFDTVSTTRDGIYVCGPFSQPKDIPETVMEASSASSRAMVELAEVRGTEVEEFELPPERSVAGEPPRVGVFVCHCGLNIGGIVDVPSVAEYASKLPGVVYATDNMYTCSSDTQEVIKERIEEYGLNRVVVASCSPRTHEPLFQQTIREAGLNPNLFEMANIRDQCSWVHMHDHEKATFKSKDLVRMAVAKANLIEPLGSITLPVNQKGFVLGGGLAGMTAALAIADQGFEVFLVEKGPKLGGNALKIKKTIDGRNIPAYVEEAIDRVKKHKNIKLFLNAELKNVDGFIGNFVTTIEVTHPGNGKEPESHELEHGIVVVATGGQESTPEEYLYGKNDRVKTLLEVNEEMTEEKFKTPDSVVMIQCVGSREPEHQYCSRICCAGAVKSAIAMKEENPDAKIFILNRDMRTYGFREEYYTKAREMGIIFIKYDLENKPKVEESGGELKVKVYDSLLDAELEIPAELLVLSARIDANSDNPGLCKQYKVPLNADNFFLEAHVKLRPVDFATEGVFVAGFAHYPKDVDESISQAMAAAGRALTVLSRDTVEAGGKTAYIDPQRCNACGACVTVCPYNAISIDEEKEVAVVNEVLCKGCGGCVSTCKGSAPDLKGFKDEQILHMINVV
jgi:heterodisulfide reductase subunit A